MGQRVFVDANIFCSKTLMDWTLLLRAECGDMFQVHSTEDVLAETIYSMRRRFPDKDGSWTKRRAELIRNTLDEVLADFDSSVEFTGTDPDDRHVHSGATAGRADFLLTQNSSTDFTANPDRESYEVICADDFFMLVAASSSSAVREVTISQFDYWNARGTTRTLGEALRRAGCPTFAAHVEAQIAEIEREIGDL